MLSVKDMKSTTASITVPQHLFSTCVSGRSMPRTLLVPCSNSFWLSASLFLFLYGIVRGLFVLGKFSKPLKEAVVML